MSKTREEIFATFDQVEKIKEMFHLLVECRDALPAITLASAKLRGIDLTLANRIDKCLEPWEVEDGEEGGI